MAFVRTRRQRGKNGNVYLYSTLEVRWREGGKVRSRSTHLGKAHGAITQFLKDNFQPEPGAYLGAKMQAENDKYLAEQAAGKSAEPPSPGESAPDKDGPSDIS